MIQEKSNLNLISIGSLLLSIIAIIFAIISLFKVYNENFGNTILREEGDVCCTRASVANLSCLDTPICETGLKCHPKSGGFKVGKCIPICGDGLSVGNEECDDGNKINDDGCDINCKIENERHQEHNNLLINEENRRLTDDEKGMYTDNAKKNQGIVAKDGLCRKLSILPYETCSGNMKCTNIPGLKNDYGRCKNPIAAEKGTPGKKIII